MKHRTRKKMMNRMNWIILALLLTIPGLAGLGWGHLQKNAVEKQTSEARKAVLDAPSAEEYLSMYDQWFRLTPAQKAENPWGQGQYGGPEIQKRLREDQTIRFEADLIDLDKGLKSYPQQLADVLYGDGWDQRLSEFQRQREYRDLILTGSVIIASAGSLIFCGGLISCLMKLLFHKKDENSVDLSSSATAAETSKPANQKKNICKEENKSPKGNTSINKKSDIHDTSAEQFPKEEKAAHNRGYFESSQNTQKRSKPAASTQSMPISAVMASSTAVIEPAPVSDRGSYFGWAMDPEEENTSISTMMTTQPVVKHGLTELTEEVSAIRQYAAAQQDQMRKLQDGYDWVIIRRFCLRVIRCIDNLDDRMSRLEEKDQLLMSCMEDIHDELVFALESSGVEQFRPDLNVPFKGLEKYAEAIRQRIPAPDAALAGAIAEIVRPGYQYLISDDDVKIVRCAQVRLYDTAETEV
jgi:molecular chaperone GrpE (heat shock protein)